MRLENIYPLLSIILVCSTSGCLTDINSKQAQAKSISDSPELEDYNSSFVEYLKKIRQLLAKNKKCYLATIELSDVYKGTIVPAHYPKVIDCIADTTYAANTVNEKSGCARLGYNPNTNQYVGNRTSETVMVSKSCSNGGFEELLKSIGHFGLHGKSTVEVSMLEPLAKPLSNPKIFLLHADNSKVNNWYEENKSKYIKVLTSKEVKNAVGECIDQNCYPNDGDCIKWCKKRGRKK